MCRVLLVSNLFTKPCQYTMSKLIKSSIFAWVPTTEFIHENYDQMLIDSLMEGNMHEAFKLSFILKSKQNDVENAICPLWPAFYQEKVKALECSTCKIGLQMEKAFVTKCGHFYCVICCSYMIERYRESSLTCSSCRLEIESLSSDLVFFRPI